MFDREHIPVDRYNELVSAGYLTDHDLNIKPSTCAFITKVSADTEGGTLVWTYLCGIKRWTLWYQLIASNTPTKDGTQTGNYESRVSGALALDGYAEDSVIRRDFFVCKYCDRSTAEASKHGVAGEEFVEFPMCNCYTPRGGMAISVFDGAVQGHLATGYVPDPNDPDKAKEFQNVYNIWNTYKDESSGSPPSYAGGIPKYIPDNLASKAAFNPKLSITQMMLNARALVAPCCWYTGVEPYIYKPSDFRVVDLAIALDVIRKKDPNALPDLGNMPTVTTKVGVSDMADYTYEEGDIFYGGLVVSKTDGSQYTLSKDDAYLLNSLFGRHYDWTLPDCGNNKRIIYIMKQSHVIPVYGLLPEDVGSAGCKSTWFNYRENSPLSPKNCSHPDCSTKYNWGHLCNGGGAFSLSDGRACPYYQNPLMGDKDTERRYCKLQNMYPGDSVTAAAMLQIMWMSKGGLPWTEEEWKSTWLNPYIWATVPFNPVFKQTNKFYDDNGNEVEGFWHHEYEVYSRKTKINPGTGEIELLPMRKLPGGSVSAFKRKQDRTIEDGLQVPDVPTIIRKIELSPTGQLKIIWPCPSLSDLTLSVTNTQLYQDSLRNLKSKVYNKIVWNSKGLVTDVVGQAVRGQYQTGIYCLNTAFLQGMGSNKNWSQYREYIENKLLNMEIASKEAQDMLQELWFDLNRSQITGNESILKNFALLKAYLDSRGMFIFSEVSLSPLDNPNHIIVFGFSSAGCIDADIVKVRPIVRHAWMYQKNTKLMTSWKTVWNGRPSLFLNEKYLRENISEPVEAGALAKGGTVIQLGSWYYSTATGEFVSELSSINDSITGLEREIASLNERLRGTPAPSVAETEEIQNTITEKQSQLSSLRSRKIEAEGSAYSQEINQVQTSAEKTALVTEITKKITALQTEVKALEAERDRYTKSGETARASQTESTITDKQKEISALEKKRDEATEVTISDSADVSADQKTSTSKYSYRDKTKHSGKGDTDTNEGGVVKDETSSTAVTTVIAKETPVENLYVPFLNTDRTEFRDVANYNTIDVTNSHESITLSIPDDSGVIEWGHLSIGPPSVSRNLSPWKTFSPKALKKVVVYSTREADKESPNTDKTKPNGAKITEKIATWYKASTCASTIILVVNPDICNASNEFMIFGMQAVLKQKYKDATGNWQTENKIIKFMPMNYSQVTRPFPGYSTGKTAKRIGTKTVDGVDYTRVEVSEFIEVFEKQVTGSHPWVFFASPVDYDVTVKEWRFYNNQWYPVITGAVPITIPDKTEVDLYMEYAYIGEMYDENEAESYEWGTSSSVKTRILFSSPKAGIMRTVFKYTNTQEVIDGYTNVPLGSHTVSTIWPYARQACRDYEITYIWRDTYKGEELTTGNMKNRTSTNYAASLSYNKTKGTDRTFTLADQGDHDLGTEFQPKLTYSTTTSTNVTAGTARNKITRAEWSTSFEDKTEQYITNKNPTYGFPEQAGAIYTPADNVGALYYPYTRAEPSSAYVPRHKTFMWDFMDRWRNKTKDSKDMGCFRMQAYDWCVKGTDVVRIRQWSRHWLYDTKRETKFLGRSKTRGPVFQLEYREYFDLPTKTVFLIPYMATSSSSEDNWYCSACNRYFSADVYGNDGQCPLCSVAGQVSQHSGTSADCLYLVNRVDSESVELQTDAETLTEEELAAFVPDDPSQEAYDEWEARVTQLYDYWKTTKDSATLESMQREQARGRLKGWIVDYSVGLKFINDEESQSSSDEQQKAKEISQKSQVNMLTGCDKYGDKKRLDLGAFQLSDEYVPGSVTSYYGVDSTAQTDVDYDTALADVTTATQELSKITSTYNTFITYQKMIQTSPNAQVTYDGTVYGSATRAATSNGQVSSIDDKVSSLLSQKTEAETKVSNAKSKASSLSGNSARNQAKSELAENTAVAREKVEAQVQRYYEYQQTAYGYNYPWSPYDSSPLFGNTGREMFALEICTIGGIISWLPKQSPTVASTFPAVPSWWTARNPDGEPREMVIMLTPPLECSRVLTPLSAEAHNPFYNYIFNKGPFYEVQPETHDPTIESRSVFINTYDARDLRIVTEHDPSRYGQPFVRSDVGRFTLTVTSDSKMSQIYVTCNSAAQIDTQDMSEAGLLLQDTSTVSTKDTTTYPDPHIDGNSVKAFSVLKGDYMYVGQRYPGYSTEYDHGKFFTGYNSVSSTIPGWVWPSDVRDTLIRGVKTVKWYQDLYPPELSTTTKNSTQLQPNYVTEAVNNQGLWAIPSLKCAPYYKKIGFMDDGRDVTGGPSLDEVPNNTGKLQREKSYVDTSFAIIVESERVNENGVVRPPIVWVEKLQNSDFSDIGYFKVPSSDQLMVHRVTTLGALVPVILEKGDESSKDSYGYPNYKTAFSTGNISDIDEFPSNPDGGANLIVFTTDGIVGQNEAGIYPGFVAGAINYRTLGKVYREKQIPKEWYSEIKLDKQRGVLGQNQHKVSATFTLKNFFANALFVKVELNEWFNKANLDNYLHNTSDAIALEVKVSGTPAPGGESFPSSFPSFTTTLPIDPSSTTKTLELTYNCDLGITYNLIIDFIWWVRTDSGNFNLGIWKEVPETKRELKPVWTGTPVYAFDGSLFTTRYEWVDTWVDVPDPTKYAYLGALLNNLTIGALMPGKCAEVVTVKEARFGISAGKPCNDDGKDYNFFTESDLGNYKSNWETFDKKTNTETGWWKDSGRLTSEDAAAAGTDQQWSVKAEQQMWEKLRSAEESSGLYDAQGKSKSSSLGKEPAAQIFPRVCAELPELPVSRLKINAWNALNWGELPDTRDPYEWPQKTGDIGWTWGGIWTTRMAGPEWVTTDQYPTRDAVWWPALPYKSGKFVTKGLYINFGPQYKDESLVINDMKYRGIDPNDEENQYAYKYEVRGFDALLKTIETVEQTTAEDRRSANYAREYGVTYTQKATGNSNSLTKGASEGSTSTSALAGTAAGASVWNQTQNAATSSNWADQMAQNAVDGISQAANTPNYRVVDQRNWVFLDEINMKVDQVNWEEISKREDTQKTLWDKADGYRDSMSSMSFTAIIPYHEWNEILEMTGYFLKLEYSFLERGFSCVTTTQLKEQVDSECKMEWKVWDWSEVASFSFRDEEKKKYPLKAQSAVDWKTILTRKCGSKWVHKDTELDGGKVWTKWDEAWAVFMKRGRERVKFNHPVIVSYDCKRKTGVAETEQNLEHFVDAGGVECKEMEQKWTADGVSSWPKTVSSDGGTTLNRSDPWWRF
jgi:uncharacterized small protein (DUF1192 family)